MADAARTLSQLLAQFADNLVGAISAQDGRDLCVSAMGWEEAFPPSFDNDSVDTAAIGAWFAAGSTWIDTNHKKVWLCVDGAPADAIWIQVNSNFFPDGIICGTGNLTNIPLLVGAAPGQSTALVDVQDASFDDLFIISPTGRVTITSNNDIGLVIQNTQRRFHDDLAQFWDSHATVVARISYTGEIAFQGLIYENFEVSTSVTLDNTDAVLLVDASARSIVISLPDITTVTNGRTYTVKRVDSASANTVSIATHGIDKIDGVAPWPLTSQYESVTIMSDGSDWWIISQVIPGGGGGSGTVTSVGLALPAAEFIVTGSPVTTAGILTGSWQTQAAGTVFAGPAAGADAIPSFKGISNEFLPKGAVVALHAVIDYTSLVAAGALTTVSLNLLAPLPPDCMVVAVAYAQDTGNAFTGGTISSIFASFFVGTSGPYGTINVHNPTLPQSGAQIVTVLKNVYGDTSSNWSITFSFGGGDASQLTNGQLDCWLLYTRLPD